MGKKRAIHPDWQECQTIEELVERLAGNCPRGFYESMKKDIADVIQRAIEIHEQEPRHDR